MKRARPIVRPLILMVTKAVTTIIDHGSMVKDQNIKEECVNNGDGPIGKLPLDGAVIIVITDGGDLEKV